MEIMEVTIIVVVHLEGQDLMVILVQHVMEQVVVHYVQGEEKGETMMVDFMIVLCVMVVVFVTADVMDVDGSDDIVYVSVT